MNGTSEHIRDIWTKKDLSHIKTHPDTSNSSNPSTGDISKVAEAFEIKVVRTHRKALCRQIHETLSIHKAGGKVLNNKEEYTRCVIPQIKHPDPSPPVQGSQETPDIKDNATTKREGDNKKVSHPTQHQRMVYQGMQPQRVHRAQSI